MSNEKNKIEALMFAVAKRIHLDEISKITGIDDIEKIKAALSELKAEYDAKGSSMVLNDEGEGYWKLTVRDHYMPMVQKVLTQTELDRPLMETLSVIAWKYPVLQAEVIKIRHNKAYDHLKQLEELGFIIRNKFGRTSKITLTQKFFEYFDLPSKEQAKEVFKSVVPQKIREKVENAENEINNAERKIEEYKKKQEEMKNKEKQEKAKETAAQQQEPKQPAPMHKAEDAKKGIEEVQKKEDRELKEIEEDIEEIKKEEEKKSYS